MTMLGQIIASILIFLLPSAPLGQYVEAGHTSGSTAPAFKAYAYTALTSSTAVSSINSTNALNVAVGDWVVGICVYASTTTLTADTLSDSQSNSYTGLTLQHINSHGYAQVWYSDITTASSTMTFTCTPSASVGYQSMAVLDFSCSTCTATSLVTSYTTNFAASLTTPTWTTGGRTLNVYFVANVATGASMASVTAGNIAGNSSTLAGVSASSLTTTAEGGGEYYVSSGSLTSQTAAMSWTGNIEAVGTFAAIRY